MIALFNQRVYGLADNVGLMTLPNSVAIVADFLCDVALHGPAVLSGWHIEGYDNLRIAGWLVPPESRRALFDEHRRGKFTTSTLHTLTHNG